MLSPFALPFQIVVKFTRPQAKHFYFDWKKLKVKKVIKFTIKWAKFSAHSITVITVLLQLYGYIIIGKPYWTRKPKGYLDFLYPKVSIMYNGWLQIGGFSLVVELLWGGPVINRLCPVWFEDFKDCRNSLSLVEP